MRAELTTSEVACDFTKIDEHKTIESTMAEVAKEDYQPDLRDIRAYEEQAERDFLRDSTKLIEQSKAGLAELKYAMLAVAFVLLGAMNIGLCICMHKGILKTVILIVSIICSLVGVAAIGKVIHIMKTGVA